MPSCENFYPRPPRGGRPAIYDGKKLFSAISIHALREEGDTTILTALRHLEKFLSTPSARRATTGGTTMAGIFKISIHALREEGDFKAKVSQSDLDISIHALREEGDRSRT